MKRLGRKVCVGQMVQAGSKRKGGREFDSVVLLTRLEKETSILLVRMHNTKRWGSSIVKFTKTLSPLPLSLGCLPFLLHR